MEKFKKYPLLYAVSTLIGMIVGAGTFGIPYAFSGVGFGIGIFYLALLGFAVMAVHLFYGEVVLRTSEPRRLVGYASKYLGKWARRLTTGTILFEYYGSLLAYTILGGQFLSIILSPWLGGSSLLWGLVFFAAGAFIVFWGIKTVARNEFIMVGLMFLTLAVLFFKGAPLIRVENFQGFDLSRLFLPYGVILFAMGGSAAIPQVRQILRGQERKLKKAIILGTVIPIVVYFLFALVVVGISGTGTSEDAIKGLVPYFGAWVIDLGAIFGIFAIITSFLCLGISMRDLFYHDYKIKKIWSFVLTFAIPLILYLAGFKSFIFIIGFLGAFASGLDAIITILIYFKAKKKGNRRPEYSLPLGRAVGGFLILLFAIGFIYQIIYLSGN